MPIQVFAASVADLPAARLRVANYQRIEREYLDAEHGTPEHGTPEHAAIQQQLRQALDACGGGCGAYTSELRSIYCRGDCDLIWGNDA